MLQQDEPGDYVIATGEQHSVREFCLRAFAEVGIGLAFSGEGADEVGVVDAVDADLLAAPATATAASRRRPSATTRSRRAACSCASTTATSARPRSRA